MAALQRVATYDGLQIGTCAFQFQDLNRIVIDSRIPAPDVFYDEMKLQVPTAKITM